MKTWIEIIRKHVKQTKVLLEIEKGRDQNYEYLTPFACDEGEDKGEEYVINCFPMIDMSVFDKIKCTH